MIYLLLKAYIGVLVDFSAGGDGRSNSFRAMQLESRLVS